MNNDILAAALGYARRGMAVLPLHSIHNGRCTCGQRDCGSPGKHPRTKTGLKEASKDSAQIETWWRKWPDANVGIVTGRLSGIVVIDVDGETGEESLADLQAEYFGPLPETWEQLTGGGGRHLLFSRPIMEKCPNRVAFAPGLDIRGDDGYIVAEPSNHISGRQYAWEAEHHPEEIPIADFPASWMDVLMPPKKERTAVELPATFPQGERNNLLFKLGASLRARGLSETAIIAALNEENRARCTPPLSEKEVETIAVSCCRYPAGEVTMSRQAVAGLPAPPAEPQEATLEALEAALAQGPYYEDAVVGIIESLDASNSPSYFEAMEMVSKAQGYKAREFKAARTKYKARQRNLVVLSGTDGEATLDDRLEGIPVKGLVMPGDWRLSSSGTVFKYEDKGGDIGRVVACPHPVMPTERLHNLDSDTEKLRIAFRRDDRWQDVVVDAATAASRASVVQLANFGLQVTSESAKHLVTYLSEFATANRERLPMRRSTSRLGWIGVSEFAPYTTDVAYDGELTYRFAYDAVHEAGEFADWLKYVVPIREKAPLLRTVLAASFTAPLMGLTRYPPFFVHMWGPSGGGKSAAQKLALSVWGDPESLLKTLNTTMVGLERHAAFYHSIPMALDELQSITKRMDIDTLIYALCLGKSKGRGTAGGGVEIEREWKTLFLTSGEEPLSRDSSQGGARNRVLEFYFSDEAWKGTSASDATIFSMNNYGHAGRKYVEALISFADGKRGSVQDIWQEFRAEIADSDYTDKYINNVSMLALGDYFSSIFVFGESEEQAKAEAMALAMDVLERLDKAEDIDPIVRAWHYLSDWVESNKTRFAMDYEGTMPRLGYLLPGGLEDGSDMVCVIPTALNLALLEGGFSAKSSIKGFSDREWIPAFAHGGKTRFSTIKRIEGQLVRVVCMPYPLSRQRSDE